MTPGQKEIFDFIRNLYEDKNDGAERQMFSSLASASDFVTSTGP